MAKPFYNWSQTASSNATADSTVNWSEGQAPSSVNDSARAMMASAAAFRDDISGSITTGGTSTAYTVGSSQVFDTLAHLGNQMIAFIPHTTNGATVTLNVDSLGAKPLRSAPSVEILAGTLIQGTPYVATYNNSDAVFYLQGFYGNPYNVPLGGMMDFIGSSAPNSSFVFPAGQAISRTTYAALFSLVSTTYGTGDGSTTFNVPDLTGRVTAMKEASATRLTSSWFGGDSTSLGAVGGNEKNALSATNQIPQFTPAGTITNGAITFNGASIGSGAGGGTTAVTTGPLSTNGNLTAALAPVQATSTFAGTAVGSASPSSFRTTQPTIIVNKILRVL